MYLTFQYVFQNFCSVMDTVVVVSCIEYICILAVVLASISLWWPLGYLIIYHNSKVTVMADGGRQRRYYGFVLLLVGRANNRFACLNYHSFFFQLCFRVIFHSGANMAWPPHLAFSKKCKHPVSTITIFHYGVWKSQKKSHSSLRAKRATYTFWMDKS